MIAIRNETSGPAFVLASLLSAYPSETFSDNVKMLFKDLKDINDLDTMGSASISELLSEIRAKLGDFIETQEGVDNLRSEYIDLFDRGRQVNTPYETEYGRERAMVKGTELVDIAGFYRAFGFETGGEGVQAEMIDHISVELEFYSLLILKSKLLEESQDHAGIEIVLDGRRKFLKDHLGRFVGAICERPGMMASAIYAPIFKYCRDLVLDECQRLGVNIEPATWIASQAELGDISCGGSVGCLK